jgi:hypothetical protein
MVTDRPVARNGPISAGARLNPSFFSARINVSERNGLSCKPKFGCRDSTRSTLVLVAARPLRLMSAIAKNRHSKATDQCPLLTQSGHSRLEINRKVGELRHSRSAGAS